VLSYLIGVAFKNVDHGWRYMVGLGAVPSTLLFFVLPLLPESPRYLIKHSRTDEARTVITKTFPNATEKQVEAKMLLIANTLAGAPQRTSSSEQMAIMFRDKGNLRALMVACGLMAIQQLCGFNTLMCFELTSGIIARRCSRWLDLQILSRSESPSLSPTSCSLAFHCTA
jgi:MFS transporter, SP family, solute carrier family 2 (myo-inositol transporter), member 13